MLLRRGFRCLAFTDALGKLGRSELVRVTADSVGKKHTDLPTSFSSFAMFSPFLGLLLPPEPEGRPEVDLPGADVAREANVRSRNAGISDLRINDANFIGSTV